MKHIYIILAISLSFSCKAQNIVPLDGPVGANNYQKDLDNVRANFEGTWKYVNGTTEFILHIYKKDMISQGNFWGQGESWADKIIGNYIYKENGVELINSTEYMPSLTNKTHSPFFGFTKDGISTQTNITSINDFGKPYLNYDCELRHKVGQVSMEITNIGSGSALEATFKISPTVHTVRTSNPACNDTNDYSGFSIPTEMVLIKISDTPPDLN